MARRRKYKVKKPKKSKALDGLVNFAAGAAMSFIAGGMEEKYQYTKKGKINPYAVAAVQLGTGRANSYKRIVKTTAHLNALGSFDVEPEYDKKGSSKSRTGSNGRRTARVRSYHPDDPVVRSIRSTRRNDNRYAWRMNCEDGSAYGIHPEDYETREAYSVALTRAKGAGAAEPAAVSRPESEAEKPASISVKTPGAGSRYCRISRLDNGENQYYNTEDPAIKVGNIVTIKRGDGSFQGVVIAVGEMDGIGGITVEEGTVIKAGNGND